MLIYQVDAFTDRAFAGNSAAVCMVTEMVDDQWMQSMAMEMNLSETAFLYPQGHGYSLRWFTPTVEVDLCGHATLASAHVLWDQGYLEPSQRAVFHTKSGLLTAELRGKQIMLDFPAQAVTAIDDAKPIAHAVDHEFECVGTNGIDVLIEFRSETDVREYEPDFAALEKLDCRGIIITARGSGEYDFVSRFFGPAVGVVEDPVTGSAHCALGPYWRNKLGKNPVVGYQASKRGGVVKVEVCDDRVNLYGEAVTVMRGELLIKPVPL